MAEELWTSTGDTSLRLRAYDCIEDAPTLIALPGLVAGIDGVLAAAAADPYDLLCEEGCNVLAVDWPGHGRSGGRRGYLDYRLAMAAAGAAVDAAESRWGKAAALFGSGVGGVLAYYAAIEDGRVQAVACEGLVDLRDVRPVLGRTRRAVALPFAGLLARTVSPWLQARLRVPVRALLAASDLADDAGLAAALLGHPQSVRSYPVGALAALFCTPEDKPDVRAQGAPVLAVAGGSDRLLPPAATRAIVHSLASPAEMVVVPRAGHGLSLQRPSEVLPAVAAFVRRNAQARAAG